MLNKKELAIMSSIETQIEHCKSVNPDLFNIYLKEIERLVDKIRVLTQKFRKF